MSASSDPLGRLSRTLLERAQTLPEGSYTTKLMKGGIPELARKLREETEEMIEAAEEPGDEGRRHFVYEAGDLFYHALALLAYRGVSLEEVSRELARREGTSGLVEKANRTTGR